MSCKKCGSKYNVCGCKDTPLTTASPDQSSSTCPSPQVCSEFTYTGCILYNGPEIIEIGITPGMSLNEILQRLVIYAKDPANTECLSTTYGDCQSVTDLSISYLTRTSVRINWTDNEADANMTIAWSPATPSPGSASIASGTTYYDLTGMTPDTEYTVSISTPCDQQNPCPSVTIKFKTLA